jgi:hypothetical protein
MGRHGGIEALERGYSEGGYLGALRGLEEWYATHMKRGIGPSVLIRIGKTEQALDILERMFEQRNRNMPYLGVIWAEGLRDEPRFRDLMRRMNFPEDVIAGYLNDTE